VGDLIVRIGDDPIDSWPDLVAAVAVRPYGQPLNVTLTRRGERKEFTLVPRTSENGDVRSEVNIQGALVLDLTASMPTRLVIDSMSVRNVIRKDGNVLAESVRCSSVLQFVPCGDVQATGAAR
jgi:hypothetical protein